MSEFTLLTVTLGIAAMAAVFLSIAHQRAQAHLFKLEWLKLALWTPGVLIALLMLGVGIWKGPADVLRLAWIPPAFIASGFVHYQANAFATDLQTTPYNQRVNLFIVSLSGVVLLIALTAAAIAIVAKLGPPTYSQWPNFIPLLLVLFIIPAKLLGEIQGVGDKSYSLSDGEGIALGLTVLFLLNQMPHHKAIQSSIVDGMQWLLLVRLVVALLELLALRIERIDYRHWALWRPLVIAIATGALMLCYVSISADMSVPDSMTQALAACWPVLMLACLMLAGLWIKRQQRWPFSVSLGRSLIISGLIFVFFAGVAMNDDAETPLWRVWALLVFIESSSILWALIRTSPRPEEQADGIATEGSLTRS